MNEYKLYEQKINELKNIGLEPIKSGESTLGQPLYYYKLSKRVDYRQKPIKVLVQAGIHAREYITTFLLFKLVELIVPNLKSLIFKLLQFIFALLKLINLDND